MTINLTSDARDRLATWLAFKGFTISTRAGRDFVRVERRKGGPIKLYLHLIADGWRAAGDRKSHRSRPLEKAIEAFNDAERIISGRDGDALEAHLRSRLDDMPDVQVQQMADYYATLAPLTLEDIGRETVAYPGAKPFVPHRTLAQLVVSMRSRAAYLAEVARRDGDTR